MDAQPNDLEEAYRLAAERGDDAKLLRALARNVVFISQPKDGTPVGQVTVRHHEPGQLPLPTAPGADGRTYVLEPEDMRTVGLLFAGANVRAAFQPGAATPVGLKRPETEPEGFFDGIRAVAAEHPEIEGIAWALARLDEPEARVWPIVGVPLADGTDPAEVMPQAAESFAAFPEQYVECRALGSHREPDEIEQWLLEHGRRIRL